MGMQGGEAVEIALANTLTQCLNTELDDIWAQFAAYDAANGGPNKVYPKKVLAGQRTLIDAYPAVQVTWLGAKVALDGSAGYGESGWNQVEHQVDVTVLIQGDDEHVLDRQVKRYVTALWRAVQHHQQLDGMTVAGVVGAVVTDLGQSRVEKKDTKQLFQFGGIAVTVTVEEGL
jgi:hypothetical protein